MDELHDYTASPSGSGFVSLGFLLRFDNLPTYTIRSNMGDQYKIYKWKFVVIPYIPQRNDFKDYRDSSVAGHEIDNTFMQGQHALTVDFNDSSPISNWGQVRGTNASCVIKDINKPLKVCIRPKLQKMAYDAGGTTGYMPGSGWVNMSDPGVYHYGIKYSWNIPGYDIGVDFPRIRYRIIQTVYYGIKNVQRTT